MTMQPVLHLHHAFAAHSNGANTSFDSRRLPRIRELDILPAPAQPPPASTAHAHADVQIQSLDNGMTPPQTPPHRFQQQAQPKLVSMPSTGVQNAVPTNKLGSHSQAKKDKEHARRSEKGMVQSEMGDDLECMGLNKFLGNNLYIQNRRCGLGHPKTSELSKQYAAKHLVACFATFVATLKTESPALLQRCLEQTRLQAKRPHCDPMSVRHTYCEGAGAYPAQEEMQLIMSLMQDPEWQKQNTHPQFNHEQLDRMTAEERVRAIDHDKAAEQRRRASSQVCISAKQGSKPSRVEKKTSRKRPPAADTSRRGSLASAMGGSDSAYSRYSTPASDLSVPSPLHNSFGGMGFGSG